MAYETVQEVFLREYSSKHGRPRKLKAETPVRALTVVPIHHEKYANAFEVRQQPVLPHCACSLAGWLTS